MTKKKDTGFLMVLLEALKDWWFNHHTTRKGIETAFFVFVSAVITAVLADPTLMDPQNPAWYVGALVMVLRMADNWAKHNVQAYGGKTTAKK